MSDKPEAKPNPVIEQTPVQAAEVTIPPTLIPSHSDVSAVVKEGVDVNKVAPQEIPIPPVIVKAENDIDDLYPKIDIAGNIGKQLQAEKKKKEAEANNASELPLKEHDIGIQVKKPDVKEDIKKEDAQVEFVTRKENEADQIQPQTEDGDVVSKKDEPNLEIDTDKKQDDKDMPHHDLLAFESSLQKEVVKDSVTIQPSLDTGTTSVDKDNSKVQTEGNKDDGEELHHDLLEFEPNLQKVVDTDSGSVQPSTQDAKAGSSDEEKSEVQADDNKDDREELHHDLLEFEPHLEKDIEKDSSQNQALSEDVEAVSKEKSQAQSDETTDEEPPLEMLEFESGLHQKIPEKTEIKSTKPEEEEEDSMGIDFVSSSEDTTTTQPDKTESSKEDSKEGVGKSEDLSEIKEEFLPELEIKESATKKETKPEEKHVDIDPEIAEFFAETGEYKIGDDTDTTDETSTETSDSSETDDSETANPLKSKAALNTLLALAKTYIGMDDIESAKLSLEEVLEFGSDAQKAEAQKLLDELKDK